MKSYIALMLKEEEGGYSVLFPDVPGCVTQGEDIDEAQEMASEALSAWIGVAVDEGIAPAAARDLKQIQDDKAWAKDNEVDWRDVVAVLIPVRPAIGKPKNVNVSLDSNKLRVIDAYAERRGMTRSAVLEAGAELLIQSDPYATRTRTAGAGAAKVKSSRDDRVLFGQRIRDTPIRKTGARESAGGAYVFEKGPAPGRQRRVKKK